jgi:putative phage-type endonuclease
MTEYKNLGKLGKIIELITLTINKDFNKTFPQDQYYVIVNNIYNKVIEEYSDTPYQLVLDIIERMKSSNINFNKIQDINFRNWDSQYNIDELKVSLDIPKKAIDLEKHFMNLYLTPQPEQRTQEWFDYRYNRITASDMATAIDSNPYESVESFICKKCDPNFPFLDNDFVFHGKKYEQIATMLYEHLYNSKVTEFGCLPSEKYKFLGASPDGIGSKSTLDYKYNERLGYMLEIKCPYVRYIKKKGKIAGGICPYYYYCQVQQQLECCNLDNCDFIQCKIEEYADRDEYLLDTLHEFKITEDTDGREIVANNIMSKGYLLQFLPIKFEPTFAEDKHHYKSFYIYPPRLTMTSCEYTEWVLSNLNNWKTKYPDRADNYYFDKVIYWKIVEAHTVTIPRDVTWFNSIFPILEKTWEKVLFYRNNLDQLKPLQDIADKRKNFYKINCDIKINNFEEKTDFLKKTIKKPAKKTTKKKSTVDSGFLD